MTYRYYSTQRPITPGSYPKPERNEVLEIVNFDSRTYAEEIDGAAWGYIDYRNPLVHFDVINYELEAVKIKTLYLEYQGEDSWGRYVYEDQNGKLWKNTDCCSPRECCEERGDTLNSACGNSFDGEPDGFMAHHIRVVYIDSKERMSDLIRGLTEMIRISGDYTYNKEFAEILEAGSGITMRELVMHDIFDESILDEGGERE